jgi:hypothetical protein
MDSCEWVDGMLPMHVICGMGFEIDCTCFHGIIEVGTSSLLLLFQNWLGCLFFISFLWQHTGYQYPKNQTK